MYNKQEAIILLNLNVNGPLFLFVLPFHIVNLVTFGIPSEHLLGIKLLAWLIIGFIYLIAALYLFTSFHCDGICNLDVWALNI